MSRSAHPKNTARKLTNAQKAGELRGEGMTHQQIADELGVDRKTVGNLLAESRRLSLDRMADLGEQIIAQEDTRLLGIIERGMHMVDRLTDQSDKDGIPIDYKAAQALATVLRASESRRKLYGVDAPTKIQTSSVEPLSDEAALAIIAEFGNQT